MIKYTNKSTFNNMARFILIDNVENLNKNSVNALLKIIEEPNENVFFILISNSEKNILPTLKSRCLTFKISLTFNESLNISNSILEKNVLEFVNYDLLSYYKWIKITILLLQFTTLQQNLIWAMHIQALLLIFLLDLNV